MICNINIDESPLLKFYISQPIPSSREVVPTAIYLRIAPSLKLPDIHTFQDKTPKEWKLPK